MSCQAVFNKMSSNPIPDELKDLKKKIEKVSSNPITDELKDLKKNRKSSQENSTSEIPSTINDENVIILPGQGKKPVSVLNDCL